MHVHTSADMCRKLYCKSNFP